MKYDAEFVGNIRKVDNRRDLQLVTDSQDMDAIGDYLGNPEWFKDFGGCFVKTKDGEYDELYCFDGIVPHLDKSLYAVIEL